MMNFNDIRLGQLKYQDMLKEAEHRRLIREICAGQPTRMAQLRNRFGALLTSLRQRLHTEAAMPDPGKLQSHI